VKPWERCQGYHDDQGAASVARMSGRTTATSGNHGIGCRCADAGNLVRLSAGSMRRLRASQRRCGAKYKSGAPRSTMMGTPRSPSRYDATAYRAHPCANLQRAAILRRLGCLRLVDGLDPVENLAQVAFRDLDIVVGLPSSIAAECD